MGNRITESNVLNVAQSLADELGGSIADGLVTGYRIKLNDERGTYVAAVSVIAGVELMVRSHGRMARREIFGSTAELAAQIRERHGL